MVYSITDNCYKILLSFDLSLHLALCSLFGGIGALVIEFLSFADSDLHFDPGSLEVKGERYDRKTLLLDIGIESQDLILVHQQASVAHRVPVEYIPLFIRADMHLFNEDLAVFDVTPGIL